jgi:hypothetical protein
MRFLAASLAVLALRAQPSQELDAFQKIRARMAFHLAHQPNYTCLETIERSARSSQSQKFKPVDTLRLEVALVDGKEMFGWPGSRSFEDSDVSKLVNNGAIGSGDFGAHAKALFTSRAANFHDRGAVAFRGKDAIKVDYEVPQRMSGYTIKVGETSAIVGYHGTFYADVSTYDVMRIEVLVDNMPASLALRAASDVIEYAPARIGGGDFLLPSQSELHMIGLGGGENANRMTFSSCKEFSGQSVLTFEEPPGAHPEAAPVAPRQFDLPKGLDFYITLAEDVKLGPAAIGDAVHARLSKDLKYKGEALAPKGAEVRGRLLHLEKRENYIVVGIRFSEIDAPGIEARFEGSLTQAYGLWPVRGRVVLPQKLPGEGIFAVPSSQTRLARGCMMYWRS